MRRLLRHPFLISLLAAAVALLAVARPALAHAIVLGSDPADGAVLAEPPSQITVSFSEPVLTALTAIELVDSQGQTVPLARQLPVAAESSSLVVALPRLAPDVYRLSWRTVSAGDVHITTGAIVFGVQQAVPAATSSTAEAAPTWGEVAARGLSEVGVAGLAGALLVALLVLPAPGPAMTPGAGAHLMQGAWQRLMRLALGSGTVAVLAGAALLAIQFTTLGATTTSADNWRVLIESSYGRYWLQRQVYLLALMLTAGLLGRRPPIEALGPDRVRRRGHALVTGVLLVGLAWMLAENSHAAAFNTVSSMRLATAALHLLAAGAWAGGLLALVVLTVPWLRQGGDGQGLARLTLRRFGALAASSVGVLAVTGLYSAGQQVASVDALLLTNYGRGLLLKVALGLAVGVVGLLNSASLHPAVRAALQRWLAGWPRVAPGPAPLRRRLLIESAAALGVLLLAARLGALAPARGPRFEPPAAPASPVAQTVMADDLLLNVLISPNQPGRNLIVLGAFNTRRPAPAPIQAVAVELRSPDLQVTRLSLEAVPQEPGRYRAATDGVVLAGDWQITISIQRAGLPEAVAALPWAVVPGAEAAQPWPVVISNQPLAPLLTPAAAQLAAGLLLTALALRWGPRVRRAWLPLWTRLHPPRSSTRER